MSRFGTVMRQALLAAGMALLFAPAGCSQVSQVVAEDPLTLRGNAEAFRITAARDFLKAAQAFGTAGANKQMASLAADMWPATNSALGWSTFIGTSLVNTSTAGQDQPTVIFYNPWADCALVTKWEKESAGGYKIASADMVTGSLLRGSPPPYPARRQWLATKLYGAESVGILNATTAKGFEAGGPALIARLDDQQRAAMRFASALMYADARGDTAPFLLAEPGIALDARNIWTEIGKAVTSDEASGFGPVVDDQLPLLRKLRGDLWKSFVPVVWRTSGNEALLMLASWRNPDLYIAVQLASDGTATTVRRLQLYSFQAFYDELSAKKETGQ